MAARKSAIYVAILRRLRRDAIEDLTACGWEAEPLAMLFECSERTITRTRAQIRETRARMAEIAALRRRAREVP